MGVIGIAGREGSGKTRACVEEIRALLRRGERALYLVPEQDTVEAELFLSRELNLDVLWNLEVLSPTRLAQRIRGEAGGSARVLLTDAGRAMALKGALLSLRGSLRYFSQGSQGAADQIGDLLAELKSGENDPTLLRVAADRMPAGSALAQKVYDLVALYEAYEDRLAGRYLDGEDALRRSAELAGACGSLADLTVFADGFDVLPRTTLRLLAALGAKCRAVYVTSALSAPEAPDSALFAPARDAMHTLARMCEEAGVRFSLRTLPDRALPNPEIEHLAKNLYADRPRRFAGAPRRVQAVQARDPYMEAERAAGYLFEKCRLEGWRYRDMAIVCADMGVYGQRVRQALERRGMRAYIDQQPAAADHPAAQYLLAALAGAARYYRQEDMLRALKSGYAGVTAREADRLELYAMERGLEGRLWEVPIEENDAQAREEDGAPLRSLEEIRARFVGPIRAFREGGLTRSVRGFCEGVVRLMEEDDIAGQLAKDHARCAQEGDVTRMQVVRQAQSAINRVLDQAVELCGEEQMRLEDFARLLRAGLAAISIGSIPMSPDAVYVGEIARFSRREVKILYVLGTNADSIPARRQDGGTLQEDERAELLRAAREAGVQIRLSRLSDRAAIERMALYRAFLAPKEELVLSYAAVDARGAALRKSPLLLRLEGRVFPQMREACGLLGDRYVYAGARQSMREALLAGLRAYLGGARLTPELLGLAGALRESAPAEYEQTLRSAIEGRREPALDAETAHDLYLRAQKNARYGVEGMIASISQLESFALCPFAHFVGYGLRPRELKEPRMDARERGTLEHRAIEDFAGRLYARQDEVGDEEAERLMREVLEPLFEEESAHRREGGLSRANHQEIRRAMGRMSRLMALQKRLSRFRVSAEELAFTPADTAPLSLPSGERVYLEGKIDRVDVLNLHSDLYARVIDYKTGNTALGLDDVYFGLRLQLFLYLDAVLALRGAKPAGVFYQKLSEAPMRLAGGRIDEKLAARQRKKLRLTGFILEDPDVIGEMCADPEIMDQVLPVEPRTKGGRALPGEFTERSRSRMLSEEAFGLLRRHTRRKLAELAGDALAGKAAVSPALTQDLDACKYCRFRSICGFDESLPGCERRNLQMDSEEVLQRMRKEDENA